MKTKLFSLFLIPLLFCGACSSSDDSTSSGPTTSVSQGPHIIETNLQLKRTSEGAPYHLNEGTYKIVLSTHLVGRLNEYYVEGPRQRFVDSFKYAVNTINASSEKIKFEVAAQDETFATNYSMTYVSPTASSFVVDIGSIEGDSSSNQIDSTAEVTTDSEGLITSGSALIDDSYAFNTWSGWTTQEEAKQIIYQRANTIFLRVIFWFLGFEKATGPKAVFTVRRSDFAQQTHLFTTYDEWTMKQYNHDFAGGPSVDPYVFNLDTIYN